MLNRVVDVELALVGAEAQAVRLVEEHALHQQLRLPAAGRNAIDALEAELPRPLHAIDRHAAIPGIGEIDRAVALHDDIVGAVEFAPLEMRGEHLAAAIGALAHQRRGRVLADDEVQIGIIGHAVALVRRAHHLGDARAIPAAAHIAGHVREQQVMLPRMPDRAFREFEARADLPDRSPEIHEFGKGRVQRDMRCHGAPSARSGRDVRPGTSCASARSARAGRAPPCRAGPPPARPRSSRACHALAAGSASHSAAS